MFFKYILLVGILVIFGWSCLNPFAPRFEEEFPGETCSDLTNTDNVFCVFRNAYTFKDTTLYGSVIASVFTFIYTDYDRGVDVTWGRDDEMRTTYGLFQSAQSLNLIWNNVLSSSGDEIQQTIVRGFNLTVTFNPSDITHVDGYANITMARPTANDPWKIIRWRDESNF